MTGHEQFISRQFLSVFFFMITGSERSFSYTVENCLNLKLEAVVVFCFFVTSFFPEDLSRTMAIGRPVIFFFRFRRCGLSGLPYFRFRGANPCWKLKCGCCSSIDASCCYMAWLRLKSCIPRLPYRFQIESTTVSTWHQYCYIIVVMFFSGLGQHLDFFLVPQFHMTV